MTLEEFKTEVLPLKDKLYRLAFRLLNNREEARDTIQEVMLRLWSKGEDLSQYRNIGAFALTMTRNLCLDKLKSSKWKESSFEEGYHDRADNTASAKMENKDTVRVVKSIINGLPEQQKTVIQLRDIEELDFDEIAEIMQLSLNNIRVLLSRARKKVRDELIKIHTYEFSKN
ncbi:MAG: RNA polymerase sigma factor [Bacteroidetes bacterium]|nr:RNA polymerase sigma factor [Bacteroidota bacterium]